MSKSTIDFASLAVARPPKASTLIAERLQALILSKKLRPGAKLPPERTLCEHLGVSRTVLREAIKLLSARGLIKEVNGKGSFVNEPNFDAVRNSLKLCLNWHAEAKLANLVELRQLVEVEAVGLAATRATKGEIDRLRQTNQAMASLLDGSVEQFVKLDLEFHKGLAAASHNELFVMLLEAIAGALVGSWKKICRAPEVRRHGIKFHEKILRAVEQRNPTKARHAMKESVQAYVRDVQNHLM